MATRTFNLAHEQVEVPDYCTTHNYVDDRDKRISWCGQWEDDKHTDDNQDNCAPVEPSPCSDTFQ